MLYIVEPMFTVLRIIKHIEQREEVLYHAVTGISSKVQVARIVSAFVSLWKKAWKNLLSYC